MNNSPRGGPGRRRLSAARQTEARGERDCPPDNRGSSRASSPRPPSRRRLRRPQPARRDGRARRTPPPGRRGRVHIICVRRQQEDLSSSQLRHSSFSSRRPQFPRPTASAATVSRGLWRADHPAPLGARPAGPRLPARGRRALRVGCARAPEVALLPRPAHWVSLQRRNAVLYSTTLCWPGCLGLSTLTNELQCTLGGKCAGVWARAGSHCESGVPSQAQPTKSLQRQA